MKITPIKLRRVNAGYEEITQSLLDALKISKSTFYKLEQGWSSPSPQLIARLAKTYNCTTDEIFKDFKITG